MHHHRHMRLGPRGIALVAGLLGLLGTLAISQEDSDEKSKTSPEARQIEPVDETVSAKVATPAGQRWALLIGIEKYEHVAPLTYCADDVQLLRETLVQHAGYLPEHVHVLSDDVPGSRNPSRGNILFELKEFLREAKVEDTVLVAFSGHGEVDKEENCYLVPIDGNTEQLEDTCVPVSKVHQYLAQCPAERKVVIFDACHAAGKKGNEGKAFDLSRTPPGKGMVELLSCTATQVSYEYADLGHGVFSHYLSQALKGDADLQPNGNGDGFVSVEEVYPYVQEHVLDKTDRKQSPVIRRGEVEGRLTLAVMPNRIPGTTLPDELLLERLKELEAKNKVSPDLLTAATAALKTSSDFQPARALRLGLSILAREAISEAEFRTLCERRFVQIRSHQTAEQSCVTGKARILSIGVSEYPKLGSDALLKGCAVDAGVIRDLVGSLSGKQVAESVVLNGNVSEAQAVQAIGNMNQLAAPGDVLVLLYSGRGHTVLGLPRKQESENQHFGFWGFSEFESLYDLKLPGFPRSSSDLPARDDDGAFFMHEVEKLLRENKGHVVVVSAGMCEGIDWPPLEESVSLANDLVVKWERETGPSRLWIGSLRSVLRSTDQGRDFHSTLQFFVAALLNGRADVESPFSLLVASMPDKQVLNVSDGFVTIHELGATALNCRHFVGAEPERGFSTFGRNLQVRGWLSNEDVVLTRSSLPLD